jgi:hypothetical protein
MNPDPPKYRPLERFWPYAELPEQPTDEEVASLDPDLQEALFGTTAASAGIVRASGRATRRSSAICFRSSAARTPPRFSSTIGPSRTRASCGSPSSGF